MATKLKAKARTRAKSMPRLTHMGINVTNLDRMVGFYTRYLGLTVSDRGFSQRLGYNIAFMTGSPTNHHQIVMGECRKPGSETTVNQISFTLGTLDDVRDLDRRLRAAGVETTPIDHGNAWSVYFPDPEGNRIECYIDAPWQVAQPHGVALDLSLANDEIKRRTRARIKDEPTFMPAAAWAKKTRAKLAAGR